MKKKGFTLTELIIVIAIFGILLAVVTPAWMSYLQRSKFRTYNQRAKTIFNAAQIVITEMEFAERQYRSRLETDSITGTATDAEKAAVMSHIGSPKSIGITSSSESNSNWFFYYDGGVGRMCLSDGSPVVNEDAIQGGDYDATQIPGIREWENKITSAIRRIVGDDCVYKIWVEDYIVKSVSCAESPGSRFIGAHPKSIYQLESDGVDVDDADLKHTTVRAVDLSWFDSNIHSNGTLIAPPEDEEGE